jgi:N-acetyl sugar amidotransferase
MFNIFQRVIRSCDDQGGTDRGEPSSVCGRKFLSSWGKLNRLFGVSRRMVNSQAYQICAKLVMDTSDPDICFDSQGVCNHYHEFQNTVRPLWNTGPEGRRRLEEMVSSIKKSGQGRDFDCIMGLSGGADSSYMLHVMVSEFDLRPLVFHVDAGWNSEIAVHNINCMIDKLDLDLFTEVINWEEVKNFQLAMFKSGLPNIDLPQDIAFIGVLFQYAAKHGIRFILNGGNISTECVGYPQQYYYFADMAMVRDVLNKFGTRPMSTYPFTSTPYRKIVMPYIKGVKMKKPLNCMPYLKSEAMETLRDVYGWKPYVQKHFESRFTRFLEGYWLPTRFGYDVRRVQFSSMILTGQMTREEALQRLEASPYDEDLIRQDFDYIAAKLGIGNDELRSYHMMPKKFYWDYRNRRNLFEAGERVLSRIEKTKRGGAF